MGFSSKQRKRRQEIIDGYLQDTGRNSLVPDEFLEWLRQRPDHEAYPVFFGKSDVEAAQAYRRDLVRHWVSGLRISVRASEADAKSVCIVPMMFSPEAGRRNGGGYVVTDMDDPEHVDELARQAGKALSHWIERYGGVVQVYGCNVKQLEKIAGALLKARVSQAA